MTAARTAVQRRHVVAAVLALAAAFMVAAPVAAADPQTTGVEWTGVEWTGVGSLPTDTSGDTSTDPNSNQPWFMQVPDGIEWTMSDPSSDGTSTDGVEWTQ
jgi:hypothetical protein